MQYKSKWGTVENLELHISSYADNKSLFMELISMDGEYLEPYGNITVNLGGDMPDYCAFVDRNNMPEMEQFIVENELGIFTGLERPSGFCTYPLYWFNPDELSKLCPDGLAAYEKARGIEPEREERERSR